MLNNAYPLSPACMLVGDEELATRNERNKDSRKFRVGQFGMSIDEHMLSPGISSLSEEDNWVGVILIIHKVGNVRSQEFFCPNNQDPGHSFSKLRTHLHIEL